MRFFTMLFSCTVLLATMGRAQNQTDMILQLIEAGEYAEAIQIIEPLLQAAPDDVFLNRLQGYSLLMSGNAESATMYLQKAHEAAPTDISSAFFLAQAYSASGRLQEALTLFQDIAARPDADADFAAAANAYADEIERLAYQMGPSTRQKWDLVLQSALKYDDNVPSRAKDSEAIGPQDSVVSTWVVSGSFRLVDESSGDKLTSGFRMGLYQSLHEEAALKGYNLSNGNVGFFTMKTLGLGGLPMRLSNEFTLGGAMLDGEKFSTEFGVEPEVEFRLGEMMGFSLGYVFADVNFEDDSSFPEYFSRDGQTHEVVASFRFYLFDNKLIGNLGYGHTWSFTKGTQYRSDDDAVFVSLFTTLPGQIDFGISGSFNSESFEKFVPQPQRLDDQYLISAQLGYSFNDQWSVQGVYTRISADSSVGYADYERNISELSLRAAF